MFQNGKLCQAGENSKLRYKGVGTIKFKIKENADESVTSSSFLFYRTDNSCKFVNRKFDQFLKHNGITHKKMVRYNPESDSKLERSNSIIVQF